MAAHDDDCFGQVLLEPLGKLECSESLGREVALQTDDIGTELDTLRMTVFDSIDAEVDDLALMPLLFEATSHANGPERLDEREHLETENSTGGRFEEGDLHCWSGGGYDYSTKLWELLSPEGARGGRGVLTFSLLSTTIENEMGLIWSGFEGSVRPCFESPAKQTTAAFS